MMMMQSWMNLKRVVSPALNLMMMKILTLNTAETETKEENLSLQVLPKEN